uniref:Uncharacterized protein n=1 Tax=Arundo donax TaxID=35708 RepID=A0A0A8XV46_ARUDO
MGFNLNSSGMYLTAYMCMYVKVTVELYDGSSIRRVSEDPSQADDGFECFCLVDLGTHMKSHIMLGCTKTNSCVMWLACSSSLLFCDIDVIRTAIRLAIMTL